METYPAAPVTIAFLPAKRPLDCSALMIDPGELSEDPSIYSIDGKEE